MALPAGMSACNMCVEIMAGGTTWTDYSDYLTVVEPPTQTRKSAEAYVYGEDTAVLGMGKLEPIGVTIRGIWTDATADPCYAVMSEFQTACGDMVAVRWAPASCTTAHRAYRTSTTASEVLSWTPPGGDAGSADVLTWEAVIRSPDLTEGAYS